MDRSLFSFLDRAFELTWFIHHDKELALAITIDAITRVETLATTQDKRRYYRPGRAFGLSGRQRHRNKVSMSRAQLFQRLLYSTSEPHEKFQETSGELLAENDMTIRYIACLARICLRRNAFHSSVGLGRLLYAYTTDEALALYDLVAQDPDRLRDPDYIRACKKRLMDELGQRFGSRLKPRRAQRGERRFVARETNDQLVALVARCLDLMTPWQTSCVVPDHFRSTAQELEPLRFRGTRPDDEHPVEMNRLHALFHPDCFRRLVGSLGFRPPEECLEVPLLCKGQGSGEQGPGANDRGNPPKLGDAETHRVAAELLRREGLRRRISSGVFRVLLDGVELECWDTESGRGMELTVDAGTELVEVVAREQGEDVLLAAYLLPGLEEEPQRASVRLAGGRRFDFLVAPTSDGEQAGFQIKIMLREAFSVWVGVATLRRRLSDSLKATGQRRLWRGAAALALTIVAAFGSVLLNQLDSSFVPPRTRGVGTLAAGLSQIEHVSVDLPVARGPVEVFAVSLRRQLEARGRLADRDQADAVVTRDLGGVPPEEAAEKIALKLVNARGEVLWRGVFPSVTSPAMAEKQAARAAREIDTLIRR